MHYIRSLRPWMIVLALSLIYLSAIFLSNEADPKVFVTLGECFSRCDGQDGKDCEEDTEGYDGQFAYYIARNPADSPDCLDAPAYRAQRILLPALGWLLSFGQKTLIPWIFVAVNLSALVVGTALLEDLLTAERVSRWYALSYGLFAGVFMAVRLSTTEALAVGLVIAAIWFGQKDRLWQSALLLALAGLAKETTGFFAAGYLLYFALHRRWRDAVRLGIVAGLPFVIWQIVLVVWLGESGIGSGGAKATAFEIIPFAGVLKIATEGSLAAFLLLGVLLVIPAAVLPSMWALWRTIRDLRQHKTELYTCLLLANAAIMPFVPFSTYREFLGLLRFIPGLVLMVALYSAHFRYRRPLLYSTLWIVLILFVISG
ncbi:MAG: hypothetical protein HY866_02055 [Chloroflexi bacterium]|nr:hypothetical protein [Chloroflexota bacterium]